MPERALSRTVSFLHPFRLGGVEGEQPAGAYRIDTIDEPLDSASIVAYRRVSTTISLPSIFAVHRTSELVQIDPMDLEQALARDAST